MLPWIDFGKPRFSSCGIASPRPSQRHWKRLSKHRDDENQRNIPLLHCKLATVVSNVLQLVYRTLQMRFCPLDGTLLQVHTTSSSASSAEVDANMFVCHTCPYRCTIKQSISFKTYTPRKQVDDILGGAAAWENVD